MTCLVSQASIFIDLFHKDTRYLVSSEKCNVGLIAAKLGQVKITGHFSSHASLLIVTPNSSLQLQNIETWIFLKNKSDHSTKKMIHDLFLNTWCRLKDDINHVCGCEKSFFLLETGMISSLEYFEKLVDLSVEKYRIFLLLVLDALLIFYLWTSLLPWRLFESREIINNWIIQLSNRTLILTLF